MYLIKRQMTNTDGETGELYYDKDYPNISNIRIVNRYGQTVFKGFYGTDKAALRAMKRQLKKNGNITNEWRNSNV